MGYKRVRNAKYLLEDPESRKLFLKEMQAAELRSKHYRKGKVKITLPALKILEKEGK
jgi:hypothetical protein